MDFKRELYIEGSVSILLEWENICRSSRKRRKSPIMVSVFSPSRRSYKKWKRISIQSRQKAPSALSHLSDAILPSFFCFLDKERPLIDRAWASFCRKKVKLFSVGLTLVECSLFSCYSVTKNSFATKKGNQTGA